MDLTHTNIFCLIGKPGAGRTTILNGILKDKTFTKEWNINKLIYCTTRKKKHWEIEDESYHYIKLRDYKAINKEDIIEFRSYDTYSRSTFYIFTRKEDLKIGENYICKTTPMQFCNYHKWAGYAELENPLNQIKIYPVIINSPIFERVDRIMHEKVLVDSDVYENCTKIMSEQFEFSILLKEFPDILTDYNNENSLILNNEFHNIKDIHEIIIELKAFIADKVTENNIKTETKFIGV